MKHLQKFKEEVEDIAGQWNGDNSGRLEDQAHICLEILDKVKEIEVLIEELEAN